QPRAYCTRGDIPSTVLGWLPIIDHIERQDFDTMSNPETSRPDRSHWWTNVKADPRDAPRRAGCDLGNGRVAGFVKPADSGWEPLTTIPCQNHPLPVRFRPNRRHPTRGRRRLVNKRPNGAPRCVGANCAWCWLAIRVTWKTRAAPGSWTAPWGGCV